MNRSASGVGRQPDDDVSTFTNVGNDLGPLLLAQLCEPTIIKSYEERNGEDGVMLSHVPWAISTPDGQPSAISAGRKRRRYDSIPNYSYLDLRLSQNAAWAKSQLQRGVGHARKAQAIQDEMHSVTEASAREYKKAEQCYRDGLDLLPSHPELLVALGALCANLGGRDEEAADLLTRAVEVTSEDAMGKDSSVGSNARKYLNEVMRRIEGRGGGSKGKETYEKLTHKQLGSTEMQQKAPGASKGGEARAEKAYLDAMAEQAFLSGDTSKLKGVAARNSDSKGLSKYELLAEPSSEDEEELYKMESNDREDDERYRRRRKKKKHRSSRENRHRSKKKSSRKHKKSKRSKRKRRCSSSDSGSESSDVSSSEEYRYAYSEEESISTDCTSRSSGSRSKSRPRKYAHKRRQKKRKRRSKEDQQRRGSTS